MYARLLTLFVLLLFASVAPAYHATQPLPSSASGDYYGGGFSCRLALSAGPDATHTFFALKCIQPDGEQTTALSTILGCPSTNNILPLTRWGSSGAYASGTLWFRVEVYNAGTFLARIGNYAEVENGSGGSVILFLRSQATPVTPYPGCVALPTSPKDR